jgi:hypothetical protein
MPLTAFQQNTNGIIQPSPAGITPLLGPFSTHFTRSDIAFDYAIGGIPFIGGESLRGSYFRRVYERTFSPIRKDQFDNQQTPGEQSIWGWWLRSQSDFSLGAGLQFLDTTQDATLGKRYFYSEGLDTLGTPGQVTSLFQTNQAFVGTGPIKLRTLPWNIAPSSIDGALVLDIGAKTLQAVDNSAQNYSVTSYTMPGGLTGLANTFTDDGTNYYFADKTGIYKGAIATPGVAATKIWNVPSTSGHYVIAWVKGRLVAGLDNNVYELVGGTPPTLPTPKFTHQNSGYVFTDISETGTAILVSGHANTSISEIHKFTLDTGGAMPVLTSGIVAATMPYGEYILSMYAYIGYFVGIGTNKGFRVAVADTSGNLSYGPLVVQDPKLVGVQAISGYDRFMFIGNQGNSMIPQQGWVNPKEASTSDMLIRVDMSQLTSTNSQPFANDVYLPGVAPDGHPVNSIVNVGNNRTAPTPQFPITGLMMWSVGPNVYASSNFGNPTGSGFMYTPKIRFNTLEPKHFKYVYLRHPDISASVTGMDLYGQNPNSGLQLLAKNVTGSSTLGSSSPFFIQDVGNSQEWFQFKIVPHGNIFNGYQLRGLPGVNRQVMVEIPLLCMDHETDRYGVLSGYDGYAFQRFMALEQLTASGNIVLLQDLNYNTSNLVIVDDYKFEQQSPELAKTSSAGNQDSNAHGGYIILQCRVIA